MTKTAKDIASLRRQLAVARENLLLIHERKSATAPRSKAGYILADPNEEWWLCG